MRVISAYLLVRGCLIFLSAVTGSSGCCVLQAVLGGNESPNADDIKNILDSGAIHKKHGMVLA